jgi:uncharacterized protein YbjT (DUF2867 family)
MAGETILVTGATGSQGGAVARALLSAGHRVHAMTRKPDSPAAKSIEAAGATLIHGDLDDEASLRKAAQGAWGAFGVQNTWEAGVEKEEEQGKRMARVVKDAGVAHYVYTSVGSARRHTGIPHFDNKARIEETIEGLGIPSWTVIRPAFFMENFLGPWFKPGIDNGVLAMGLKPGTKLQMIAVKDIGAWGRLAFERHTELKGKGIELAGDELTMPEAAAIIGKAVGRTITHLQVPIEDVRKGSEDYALMLEWFDKVGYNADIAGNAKKYGIQPTRFADWASASFASRS